MDMGMMLLAECRAWIWAWMPARRNARHGYGHDASWRNAPGMDMGMMPPGGMPGMDLGMMPLAECPAWIWV